MLRGRLKRLRSAPLNYGATAAVTLLAFAIRFALEPVLAGRSPYLLFVFAVALSAIYCGRNPAIVSMASGLVLGTLVFVPPRYHIFPLAAADAIQALLFVVLSVLAIAFAQAATRDRARLEQQASRFRFLTSQAVEYAIILTDVNGLIRTWSRGAEMIFGYREDEVTGRPATLIFTPEDITAGAPQTEMREAMTQGHAADERWHIRRDGSRFYALGVLVALRDSDGNVVELAKILRDATAIKLREEQLREKALHSEKALVETTGHIDAFTYTVAHDLRAPLRAMDGFAKMLQEEYAAQLGEEGSDYLQRILGAARRMDELVTDLLEFWRLARMQQQSARVDANAVLDRVLADLHPDILAAGAHVKRDTVLPAVEGHEECLYKAFCHLLGNALKFTADGQPPEVQVGSEEHDGFVRLYFRDNGPGIPTEHHQRIFKVFERLHPNRPGTGIGLSIVHKCAEVMNGRAGVSSKPGEGACFWLDLHPAK